MKQVWSLLSFARSQGMDPNGQREVVAAIYPELRPYMVEILHGVITPDVNTPASLLAQ